MFQVLKDNSAFRRLFYSQVISFCGDWFSYVAIVTLIGDVRGGGIMALAWLVVIKQLPVFLFAALGGVLADKICRRKIMLYSDILRALITLLIIPAAQFGSTPVLVLTGLSAVVSAFFDPARASSTPQLVSPGQLRPANALGSISWSVSMLIGTALGGIATEYLGVNTTLLIDALSFGLSAYFIYQLPSLLPGKEGGESRKVSLGEFLSNRLTTLERKVAVFIKGAFGIGAGINFIQSVIGLSLGIGESGAGGVSATFIARAAGAMTGMIFSKRFFDSIPEINVILLGFFLSGVAYFSVGVTEGVTPFLLAMFVAHFGSSMVWVFSNVWIQRIFQNDERGRAAGIDVGLFMLTSCLVTVLCGELLSREIMTPRSAAEMCGILWIVLGAGFLTIRKRLSEQFEHAK